MPGRDVAGEGFCQYGSVAPGQVIIAKVVVTIEDSGEEGTSSSSVDIPGMVIAASPGGSQLRATTWATRGIRISGGGTGDGSGRGGGGGTNDGTDQPESAPVISKLTLSPKTFRAAKKGASITRVKTGTTVTFGLSKAATATFKVQKAVTGRKVGKVCRPLTKSNRRRARCTRWVAVAGSATEAGKTGTTTCRFSGRMTGPGPEARELPAEHDRQDRPLRRLQGAHGHVPHRPLTLRP